MLHTLSARRGAVTAPHHLAAQSGLQVLREGGNAIEAALAAAATIAVVYPHMNGIGGDGFWLIGAPGIDPVAIDACGSAGAGVDEALFRGHGLDAVPEVGPLSACTVAGTVSGWASALELSVQWGGRMPFARLLEDAIHYAGEGFSLSPQISNTIKGQRAKLEGFPGFAETFLADGEPPPGALFRNPRLAGVLQRLADAGPDDFYRGDVGRAVAEGLEKAGIPLTLADLEGQHAHRVQPLSVDLAEATAYNLPPPTQGLAALIILGLFERLDVGQAEGFAHVHGLVECIKQAFRVRDAHIGDPTAMTVDPASFLDAAVLDDLAAQIDPRHAAPWPHPAHASDTIWLGTTDGEGRCVSFIQSLFYAFGSGVVLADVGVVWQNRGSGFVMTPDHPNCVRPGHKPYHTLNPALAYFKDGRIMVYGTRGADGQAQTQAAIFTRYANFGQSLQESLTAPRWRLGMDGGSVLGIEDRFSAAVIEALMEAGHEVRVIGPYDGVMGHAGALVHHPDGLIEGAVDPRSDGVVATF